VLQWLRKYLAAAKPQFEKSVIYVGVLTTLLPGVALATNYHNCDRSRNNLAVQYAKAILDSCEKDAVIFTSGDNDTFPLWGVQRAYKYRQDVRVLCLSLVNTDWYVEQMKNVYGVPLSLTDDQILWNQVEMEPGRFASRPAKPFHDRPRQREVYMIPNMNEGRMVKVQDMIVDEVVIENKWRYPIFFSAQPYAESPLKLRDHANSLGIVYRLDRDQSAGGIDVEKSYDLFMNKYTLAGMEDSKVYRDENATGIYISLGVGSVRLFDELIKRGDRDRAVKLMEHMIKVYPEYWQTYWVLADLYDKEKDSARADGLFQQLHDTLTSFVAADPDNQTYVQDLGMVKAEIGKRKKDQAMIDQGIKLLREGFEMNPNTGYAFRKYVQVLYANRRFSDLQTAARLYTTYKINMGDPYAQQILGIQLPPGSVIDDN
jgi:tetratricopeptide (TPR) repeat protein